MAAAGGVRGPDLDFEGKGDGHFVYAMKNGTVVNDIANFETPLYQNAATTCLLNFFMYMSTESSTLLVHPYLWHEELRYLTILDRLDLNTLTDAIWTKVQIGIGRHRDSFKIGFAIEHDDGVYDAGVAIDEIMFWDCGIPKGPGPEGCVEETEWQCQVTKACVEKTLLCNLADDCGDGSDEVADEFCSGFTLSLIHI